jgi:hypothetical protein
MHYKMISNIPNTSHHRTSKTLHPAGRAVFWYDRGDRERTEETSIYFVTDDVCVLVVLLSSRVSSHACALFSHHKSNEVKVDIHIHFYGFIVI